MGKFCYHRQVYTIPSSAFVEVEDGPHNIGTNPARQAPLKVIDLFSGVGGLSLGAARAGFKIAAAVEKDPLILETHARNFPDTKHLNLEITSNFSGEQLLEEAGLESGGLAGLIGGPPCQGFSVIGKRALEDKRNNLFVDFFRLVAETRPAFYLAENVTGILSRKFSGVIAKARAHLPSDYVWLEPFVAKASDYGTPTSRRRAIFVGYRRDAIACLTHEEFAPIGIEPVKVKQALQGLPTYIDPNWLLEEDGRKPVKRPYAMPREYAKRLRGVIPTGVGDEKTIRQFNEEKTVLGCLGTRHTPEVEKRYRELRAGQRDAISKSTKLSGDGFCHTIRAGTDKERGSFQAVRPIHHIEARVITPREAARLQGFPDWFVFHSTKWHSFRQIGNSVSPIMAEFLLSIFYKHLTCLIDANHSTTSEKNGACL